ncbi:hypothetical protein BVY01_00405, partial [bacterium I07]
MQDVFAIQDEIALAIVDNLKLKLLGSERKRLQRMHTENLEAYRLYLLGKKFRQRKDLDSFNKALEHQKQAITLDPLFASSYAEIALTYLMLGSFGFLLFDDKLGEDIFYHAHKALELDEQLSDAYLALALAYEFLDRNQTKAEEFARKAVMLNPGNSEAVQEHGFILGRMGEFADAIKSMESTITLDPLSTNAHNGLGYIYFYMRNYKAAIVQMQDILTRDPDYFPARHALLLSLTALEDYPSALRELDKCPQTNPVVIAHRGYIYGKMES